jgi:hypothetical protein
MFRNKLKAIALALCICLLLSICPACTNTQTETDASLTDYSQTENWAYLQTETQGTLSDVFFICPTVYGGSEDSKNMDVTDTATKENFLGATNMEKGIYDAESRFFAPYYRQAALNVYELDSSEQEPYLAIAYHDIKAAFTYYLTNYNQNRPIILAGFSQGADMCIRLLKDCFADSALNRLLVACYAIGWRITAEEIAQYPHLTFASGETDTGVIISFNTEAEEIDDSFVIAKGTKTLAINPLNWKTDSTVADKSLNLGACFTNYSGAIKNEITNLTGAYIDEVRGALKVTDVNSADYPASLSFCQDGVYHVYDYQFFYRNLQVNVATRLHAYLANA